MKQSLFSLNKNMFHTGATYLIEYEDVQFIGILSNVSDFSLSFGIYLEGQVIQIMISMDVIIDKKIQMEEIADSKIISKQDLETLCPPQITYSPDDVLFPEEDNTFIQENVDMESKINDNYDTVDESNLYEDASDIVANFENLDLNFLEMDDFN